MSNLVITTFASRAPRNKEANTVYLLVKMIGLLLESRMHHAQSSGCLHSLVIRDVPGPDVRSPLAQASSGLVLASTEATR